MANTISTTITHSYVLSAIDTTITNTGGVISATNITLYFNHAGQTLTNHGRIINTEGGFGGTAIVGNSGILINAVDGTIGATAGYGVALSGYTGDFRTNTGTLLAQPTVTNAGTIGSGTNGFADGIGGGVSSYIHNQSSGTISGRFNGIVFGDYARMGTVVTSGTVVNDGTIIDYGGVGGILFGKGVTGTVVNHGLITTTPTGGYYSGEYGVDLTQGGAITNTGTIMGTYEGLYFRVGGTVLPGSVVVTNAGTIGGGSAAIRFRPEQTNLLIVDPGAVFIGNVIGGTLATTTLELAAGTVAGTIVGFGSKFTNFGTLNFDASAAWHVSASSAGIASALINGFHANDAIDITNFTATSYSMLAGNQSLVLTNSSSAHVTLSFGAPLSNVVLNTGTFGTEITTLCFCRGTRIATPTGPVPVEQLAIGDAVRTLGHGGAQTIRWIGVGRVLATRGRRNAATPVIVRKGALEHNVPNRDLRVTKGHSLYIDGLLIPVEFLVNHRTILWDDRAQEVEVFHIELDHHDVLFANGAPAESYRDDGNRWLFQNMQERLGLPPQPPFAPVVTSGPVVDAIWSRLLQRAGPRRLPPMSDDPDLHLIVDGQRVDGIERQAQVWAFQLDSRPNHIAIASRDVVPAEFWLARDARLLGIALRRIELRQHSAVIELPADDARLIDGFHDYEADEDLRWTNGHAMLPAEVVASLSYGEIEITLTLAAATRYLDLGEPAAAA